jgi:RNA polymerase sigma-70 factor (ECF subfamily)
MFYSQTLSGILQGEATDVITEETRAIPLSSALRREKRLSRATGTPEGIPASMNRPKSKQQALQTAAQEQAQVADLLLLYEQMKRPLHSYIYRLVGSQEDADDLTQEVFVRAFTAWDNLYDRANLSPWLYRIATNLCVDMLRRRRRISWWPLSRRKPDDQPGDVGSDEEVSYLPPDSGGIPEVFEREHIRLALASMPEDYAAILVLSAAQGLPYHDIATIIGITPNAAATRISRAKRMFAEQYRRLSDDDDQQEGRA